MDRPDAGSLTLHTTISQHEIKVLLIDDQFMIGEAVRRMLEDEQDISFHFVQDPTQAILRAEELRPTVILQDLVMPEIDGLTLVKFFRANAALRDIPLIVLSAKEDPKIKAEAFALGANDYLVKLPDKIELIARIRHHSRGYISMLERNEAYDALLKSQKALADELSQAADYVRSLLPKPLDGPITTDWRFIPSTSLGGDAFGYHWLDDDHLAMYLLDVCGHGVGSALLSISVMNVLRSQTLAYTDLHDPAQVMRSLNGSFQMDNHNGLFFTMWYGVFNRRTRDILYASGGHPPAILVTGPSEADAVVSRLKTDGPIIGGFPDVEFPSASCSLGAYAGLYIFSDGAYEVFGRDGKILDFSVFVEQLGAPASGEGAKVDQVLKFVQDFQGSKTMEDDFSMVHILF